MAALDASITQIRARWQQARTSGGPAGRLGDEPGGWPMIVLRTPKGWTGPAEVDGLPGRGSVAGRGTRWRQRGYHDGVHASGGPGHGDQTRQRGPGAADLAAAARRPSLDELSAGLEHEAGLAGLAQLADGSGDLREVQQAAADGHAPAQLAIAVHGHRLRREIAAMAGLDALVFTGGIGEHQPPVRAGAAGGLGFLGVAIDSERNQAAAGDGLGVGLISRYSR